MGLSDHQLIYCTRTTTLIKLHENTFIKIRTLKNYTKQVFPDKLSHIKFPKYIYYDNVNVAYHHFVELVTNIIDEIAPVN